jgi:hypothetical protein
MSMTQPPSAYVLEKSVSLYQQIQAKLADDPSMDPDELVTRLPPLPEDQAKWPHPSVLLRQAIDAEIWCERRETEAANLAKRYTARKNRYAERSDHLRATIVQLFEVLAATAAEGELGSASMVKAPAKVIADVDWLPEQYIRTTITREPDKIELAKALKALKPDETIPGAELSNPGLVVRITPF